jgi:phage terminase large subunit-like protein
MATNVAIKEDPAGNIKPDKEKSGEKIDGMVASIMGLGVAMKGETDRPKPVVYQPGAMFA